MKTVIVAEIGSNWEGSLTKAEKIIAECKKSGANAVKFQMWRAEDLYSKSIPEWKDIKKSEVSFDDAKKLNKISKKYGIEFFCSAFYPEAVNFLESINVKKYKIASRTSFFKDSESLETLTHKANTKKPMIISMGFGENMKKMKKIFSKNKIIFCYCIPEYPLKFSKINWKRASEFDGFSDHTLGITAPILFTILKKQQKSREIYIEKHVKIKSSKGPDAPVSINTDELKQMISQIRLIEKAKF
jgi:N,N'-diacetyllegionaminate synthase